MTRIIHVFYLIPIFVLAVTTQADERAKQLAVAAHAKAAAIDNLPRLLIRGHGKTKSDHIIAEPDEDPLKNLVRALDPEVPEDQWYRYESLFAWDEEHFLDGRPIAKTVNPEHRDSWHPAHSSPFRTAWWGTRELSGQRSSSPSGSATHVIRADAAAIWRDRLLPAYPNYMQATRHEFWWGDNGSHDQHFGGSAACPPPLAEYQHAGTETFDGHVCDVVVSPGRMERLWICRKTGLIRGLASYLKSGPPRRPVQEQEVSWWQSAAVKELTGRTFESEEAYQSWGRSEGQNLSAEQKWQFGTKYREFMQFDFDRDAKVALLVRFRDFREVAPGVWWPFREDRSQIQTTNNGFQCIVLQFNVHYIRTDVDLLELVETLKPKEGERVQDQRYTELVTYSYRADMPKSEILKLVDKKHRERLENAAVLQQLTDPIEQLVGQRAPELPADGWIGGVRPDLQGQPYLIHFWATWCGPCKSEFPFLKQLAEQDALIIGMHPAGTPAHEVEKVMQENQLPYPTLLAAKTDSSRKIAGYPAAVFPYCILVDSQGNVAAHGRLRDIDAGLVRRWHELRSATKTSD